MRFVLRMAAREIRASWRRLLFFFVCVAVGVGAIVALRSIIQSVRAGLTREARTLIAADVVVQTNRGVGRGDTQPTRSAARRSARSSNAPRRSRRRRWCGRSERGGRADGGAARRPGGFPFYGTLVLQDGVPYSHDLLENRGVLVRPELLTQLDQKVGDRLLIGGKPFTIRGVIAKEPGRRAGAFSLGPRVLVDYDDLKSTGLLSFGSRANEQMLLRVADGRQRGARARLAPESSRPVRQRALVPIDRGSDRRGSRARRELPEPRRLHHRRPRRHRRLERHARVRPAEDPQRRDPEVPRRDGRQVLATYVLQVVLLGLAGSLLGVVARVRSRLSAIPASLTASIGDISYGLTASAVLQGLARRAARLAAVLARAAARGAPRQAAAADARARRASGRGRDREHAGRRPDRQWMASDRLDAGRLPRWPSRSRSSPSPPGRRRRCGSARSSRSASRSSRSCCTWRRAGLVRAVRAAGRSRHGSRCATR